MVNFMLCEFCLNQKKKKKTIKKGEKKGWRPAVYQKLLKLRNR